MNRREIFAAALVAAVLGCGSAAVLYAPQNAYGEEEKKKSVRPAIGKPVLAAQTALKDKNYKEALTQLAEADAVADKTSYEKYAIEATRGSVYLGMGDYKNVIKTFEEVMATGEEPPAQTLNRELALAELNYQTKNYPKAIEYANRYYKDGGTNEQPKVLIAQAYYIQGDYPNAAKMLKQIIQADEQAGRPTSENMLLMLEGAEYQQKDTPGTIAVLKKLVAAYPKKQYWSDVLTDIQRRPGFPDRLALDVETLSAKNGTLSSEAEYMEAAQLALQKGLPGTAKSLVEQAYASGVFGKGAQAEREKRLQALATKQSADDRKHLKEDAKAAEAAKDGRAWATLADAYASYGDYSSAIAGYQKGLAKGGLKFPDDTKLHLGVAYLLAGDKAKARETLKPLASDSDIPAIQDLAHLWMVEGAIK